MSKHRVFTFTRNNPGDAHHAEDTVDCKYMVYGKEVGELGTPHRQGTIQFKWQKTEKAARKILIGCHVEICKDLFASIAYCKKDGDFVERGVAPVPPKEKGKKVGEKRKKDWQAIVEAGKAGPDAWDKLPYQDYVQHKGFLEREYSRTLKARRFDTLTHADKDTPNIWCYGPTGTGKSREYREKYPDAFIKKCNKWWDGYTDEETVLIEDVDVKHDVLGHHFKIWGDRYDFPVEIKGGAAVIRPKRIIVTSNYHPSDIWMDENTIGPIKRRFKIIHKSLPFALSEKPNPNAPNFNPGQK